MSLNGAAAAVGEVVRFTSDLIAIDTTNVVDPSLQATEYLAAEYIARALVDVGYEVTLVESGAPGRSNVFARLTGSDPDAGALLIHGHLDVIGADPAEWSVPPFSGEVRDGYVWGRGAVDMKGMLGMTLAVARALKKDGVTPRRDLVFAFFSDEESGGFYGSRWLVRHRPELFEGVTDAISEVGGFSVELPQGQRVYLLATAEKGGSLIRMTAHGTPGHASLLHPGNAIELLAAAVGRIARHTFPVITAAPMKAFMERVSTLTGVAYDENDPEEFVRQLGPISRKLLPSLRNTAIVTMLAAGTKSNVVPSTAQATIDGRMLPGEEAAFAAELEAVVGPGVKLDFDILAGQISPFDTPFTDALSAAIRSEDPGATVLPFLLSGGTDAKSLKTLGINCYGFAPLQLPADFDFFSLFHGIDERVPVSALEFGTRVLHRLLSDS